jgi:hypothetical protein
VLVSGRVPAFLVASVGVGVLMAALASPHVAAQTVRGLPGMRATIDAESDEARARQGRQPKKAKTRDTAPIGRVPTFGTPAASGAGKTGFVSIVSPRRKSKGATQPPGGAGQAQGKPLVLSPAAMGTAPDEALARTGASSPAKKSPQPKVAPKATATKRVTAPKAPALSARQDSKDQLNTRPNTVVAVPRSVEVDPFAPLGIRAGTFLLRPAIETIGGYDSNPGRVKGGSGSAFGVIAPELLVRSDWERHAFTADMRGTYTAYAAMPELNRPTVDAKAVGRIDITERSRAELEGRYILSTDRPGSPDLQAGLANLPIFTDVGTTVGGTHRFNRLELTLKGSFDRYSWEDSKLTDGTTVSNADRNYNQYAGIFRAGYELSPGFKPFVEVGGDARVRDLPVDSSGVRRSSDSIYAKAGTSFEITRSLIGEVGLGYLTRTYEDPTLPKLQGVLVDASLLWAATGLTNVKLGIRTTTDESTLPGVAGVFRRYADLQVEHAFRRWLVGVFAFNYRLDDYDGSTREDNYFALNAGLIYKLSRTWQVRGDFRQEWLKSNQSGNDYTASIATLGLRWQP